MSAITTTRSPPSDSADWTSTRCHARNHATTLFWTCSIVPLFAVYAFRPKILGELGLTGDLGNYGSAFITVMFCLGCVGSLMLVDRVGRRPLIIHSFVWAGLALLLLGIFPSAAASIILVLFAAYALLIGGTQILQWIYPNELFPTEVRGSAVGLASSLSRIGAAIGTYLAPKALGHLGIGTTMIVAAVITFVGALVSLAWALETRGMTLGESSAFGGDPAPGDRLGASGRVAHIAEGCRQSGRRQLT